MKFSATERNLVSLYYSGSLAETVYELREALRYFDSGERREAGDVLDKLETMSERDFSALLNEWARCETGADFRCDDGEILA